MYTYHVNTHTYTCVNSYKIHNTCVRASTAVSRPSSLDSFVPWTRNVPYWNSKSSSHTLMPMAVNGRSNALLPVNSKMLQHRLASHCHIV